MNPYFQSNVIINLEATEKCEDFDNSMDTIQERIRNFNQREATGDIKERDLLKSILRMLDTADTGCCRCRLLNGSSYIELQEFIKGKKAVLNLKKCG